MTSRRHYSFVRESAGVHKLVYIFFVVHASIFSPKKQTEFKAKYSPPPVRTHTHTHKQKKGGDNKKTVRKRKGKYKTHEFVVTRSSVGVPIQR